MITDLEVKRALNRIVAASDRQLPEGAWEEWRLALRLSDEAKRLDVTPEELEAAVSKLIARTEEWFGFPAPGRVVALIRADRGSPAWTPPPPTDPKDRGTFQDMLAAFEKAGGDVDELQRLDVLRRARERDEAARSYPPAKLGA